MRPSEKRKVQPLTETCFEKNEGPAVDWAYLSVGPEVLGFVEAWINSSTAQFTLFELRSVAFVLRNVWNLGMRYRPLQCPCNSILYEIKVLWSLSHQKSLVNMFNHGQHIPTLSSVQDVLRRLLQDCSRWSGAKVQHGNQQSGVAAHNLFVVAAVVIRI